MVKAICCRYGLQRSPSALITTPKPFSITDVSSFTCSWNA